MAGQLIAIVGPTASGKSELGLEIAKRFGGEIICADSRTIYKGMDIGTAKPSVREQAEVPHHLLDLILPNQRFSAAEFEELAQRRIADIQSRAKLPVLVGGSGLYAYAVLYDYQFPAGPRSERRVELEGKSDAELLSLLQQTGALNVDTKNRRRVIRAIEAAGQRRSKREELRSGTLLVGLALSKTQAQTRIAQRTEKMLSQGLIQEVEGLITKFGRDCEAFNTVGYGEVIGYLDGRLSQRQLADQINLHTWQLVRRQMTWFKRNPDIAWTNDPNKALTIVREFLDSNT